MTAKTGLCRIDLPTGQIVRICDAGVIFWGAAVYRGSDPLFGTIGSIDPPDEGVGNDVPALQIEFRPQAGVSVGDLARPSYQKALARFWIADYDISTGAVIGTPDLQFYGQLDQLILNKRRELRATVVSTAERLFAAHRGSALSPASHKGIWPGETGEDNATGLTRSIAWGVEAPPAVAKAAVAPASGYAGGLGFGAYDSRFL